MALGGIGLILVETGGTRKVLRFSGPEEMPELEDLPRAGVLALDPPIGEQRLRELQVLAKEAAEIRVTGGAREALGPDTRFGLEYFGLHPPGPTSPPEDLWILHPRREALYAQPVKRALAAPFTLAVLPFRSPSGDRRMRLQARGMSDDVNMGLTRFSELSVMSRGTSRVWRDTLLPPFEIGQRMNVRFVISGSLSERAGMMRLDVALTESASGRAIWAERFQRPSDDLFGVAEDVADRITSATALGISEREYAQQALTPPPGDLRATELVLSAQALLHVPSVNAVAEAEQMCNVALALEPGYARALSLLSRCENLRWRHGWTTHPDRTLQRALAFAQRAVDAEPRDARAHGEIGFARLYRREHALCVAAYEEALRLNPNDADMLADAADAFAHSGRASEALEMLERAMQLNPWFPDLYLWLQAGAFFTLRRYQEAVRTVLRMQDPTQGRRILAAAYAHLGQREAAEREAWRIRAAFPRFTVANWLSVVPDQDPADRDHFAEGLRRAGLP
ncbi:tetratricopeptide repeat protein [Paroceanicella profunda]|uniref:Tetratricopeptide repeat protein n=1 Tax=Paroceanicella profunda TaxID=2579971 RepID=A0A5B8FY83_9RHOB|nr:tetratricopeptide repeat protein [Paroceanicella profunda]QDL93475.1 tetratricopeptide repeat protein [Paroceanicella profunda]